MRIAPRVGDPERLPIGVELFDVDQLLFAVQPHGIAQIVEEQAGRQRALILARGDRLTRGRVGLAPQVLVGDAADLLDHLGVDLHQVDVRLRHIGAVLDHRRRPALSMDDHSVGAARLVAQFLDVIDRAFLDMDAHGGQVVQGFRGALVQVALNVPQAPDHAIRHAVTTAPIAPDRGKGESVVPIWRLPHFQQPLFGHQRDVHHLARPFNQIGVTGRQIPPVPFRPWVEQFALELAAAHHLNRNGLLEPHFDYAKAPANVLTAAGDEPADVAVILDAIHDIIARVGKTRAHQAAFS